jgi:aminodeoxyfutalosine deaminase
LKIIVPHYILTPNTLLEGYSIAYDTQIIAIDTFEKLNDLYPEAKVQTLPQYSLIMPGLINSHVHLEFSANKSTLEYGQFMPWLNSVIKSREELIEGSEASIEKAIDAMLLSGTTTFGAISSHAFDLNAASNAKQNVIFFNELIGSQAVMADALFQDFTERLDASKTVAQTRDGFIPAVAIHSPYSVHPILIKRAIELVGFDNLPLTSHFMESQAERDWLDNNGGDFQPFFKEFLKQERAVTTASEFLDLFNDTPTLFTHGTKLNNDEITQISKYNHALIHCPISNRLLGNGKLDIQTLKENNIDVLCATDGLSSNYTLNLFEEMRTALFMHHDNNLLEVAHQLIQSVTTLPAKALNLNKGEIKTGADSDMIVLQLDEEANDQLILHLILHHYPVTNIIIRGETII